MYLKVFIADKYGFSIPLSVNVMVSSNVLSCWTQLIGVLHDVKFHWYTLFYKDVFWTQALYPYVSDNCRLKMFKIFNCTAKLCCWNLCILPPILHQGPTGISYLLRTCAVHQIYPLISTIVWFPVVCTQILDTLLTFLPPKKKECFIRLDIHQ